MSSVTAYHLLKKIMEEVGIGVGLRLWHQLNGRRMGLMVGEPMGLNFGDWLSW